MHRKLRVYCCFVTRCTKIGNGRFENVSQFRYLGPTVTDHNLIQRKLKGDWIPVTLLNIQSWSLINKNVRFITKNTKFNGLSPRGNYTDWATAACRRSDCQLLRIDGAKWRVTDPYGRILGFLDRSRYFLSSSSSVVLTRLSGPRSRLITFFFW
jgi:hypothetical protein